LADYQLYLYSLIHLKGEISPQIFATASSKEMKLFPNENPAVVAQKYQACLHY
jgi:hypothetical protein